MSPVLITGGAGFVGTNLADKLAKAGTPVVVFDNLSREGVDRNLAWLRATHGERVQVILGDTRDRRALARAVDGVSAVFHFAAQVAVTTSLVDPLHDFAVNAGGTLNVLEAVRACAHPPPLLFTSTNKVYGALEDLPLEPVGQRYVPVAIAPGVSERRPLDFHSPYGCSKGAADQYVLDYARSFGLPTIVFRMSCIYGPHQLGNEDQGWVAHFLIRALQGQGITLYGDGRQVRDLLYVEDLTEAMVRAVRDVRSLCGKAFNIGGGAENTVSLLELIQQIGALHGETPALRFEPWRTGDQRYYVSDFAKLHEAIAWVPRVGVREGVQRLYRWLTEASSRPHPQLTASAEARVP